MTTTQERLIGLAEAAEAYIQQVQRETSEHSTATAQRKHDHKARLAQKSAELQQAKVN